MAARYAADAVLMVHGAFILFVIFGGLLACRWPRLRAWHLAGAAWGAWAMLSGWVCPLTPLENQLRLAAGQAGYAGGFIEHYVARAIYPDGLSRGVQVALGIGVVGLNLLVYGLAWRRRARHAS